MLLKRDRKAVSTIVGTVMIILVTVAAGTVVWRGLMPTISKNIQIGQECLDARLNIDTQSGYTCYDESTGMTTVVVSRGPEEFNLNGILLSLKSRGSAYAYIVMSSDYAAYAGDFQCEIQQVCDEGYSDILHINALTNSHLELSNNTEYINNYKVCCKSISATVNSTCEKNRTGSEPTPLFYLYNQTNSHAAYGSPPTPYNSTICLNFTSSTSTPYGAECSYEDKCTGGSTCVLGLAQETNSHVGDCATSGYKKICCGIYNQTLGKQEKAYITKWGAQYPIAYGKLPGQNEANKFVVDGEATEVSVTPVIKVGINERLCAVTAKVTIPKCATS